MIQNIALLLSFLVLSIFSLQNDQPITVTMNVPDQVQAGEELTITLHVKKGSIESFSRFTQTLPYGLAAERISTANADFSFEEQRLRIIWLKLPPEDSLEVKYKIRVNPRLTGTFALEGEFAFVEENQRKTMPVKAGHTITILPNPEIAESQRIDIEAFQDIAFADANGHLARMEVIRSEPVKSGAFEYTVELTVKKGDLSKFAKVEEFIPPGYRVVEGDSKDGIFSFNQGVVKILWMNLPQDKEFAVSYRVVPDPGKSIEDLDVNGSFSYISGNETKTLTIQDKTSTLAQETIETPLETEVISEEATTDTILAENIEPEIIEPVLEEETIEELTEVIQPDIILTPSGDSYVEEKNKIPVIIDRPGESSMLGPEKGVYYRVQLAAGHREINIDKYFARLNVQDKVKMEFHEGWRKYTTGSFYVYKDARDYRTEIWDSTPIKGAFVSAYNDGTRITVQEALMISQQKWYR